MVYPNQPYPQQPSGQAPMWQPRPQAWQGNGVQLRPSFGYSNPPRGYPQPSYPQPYPQHALSAPQLYPQQTLYPHYHLPGYGQPGQQGAFPAPPYVPYPGPLHQPAPAKKATGLVVAIVLALMVLVGLLGLAAWKVITGNDPLSVLTQYQNEDWDLPPVTSTPPELPIPTSASQARAWLTDNAIYSVALASPVRCDLAPLPGGKVTDEELQTHLESYVGCLTRVWGPSVEEAGFVAYQPQVTVYPQGGTVTTACGDAPSQNAFYCGLDQRLYIAQDVLDVLSADTASARTAFDLIIAHEYGHAMQGRTGVLLSQRWLAADESFEEAMEYSRRAEVQADCFAGLALNSLADGLQLNDADRQQILDVTFEIGDDQLAQRLGLEPEVGSHGSGDNRRLWTERGLSEHAVSICNTFVAPSDEVS